jgi:hypothetical protein
MHPFAYGSYRRIRAATGSLHGQPSAERPSPVVRDKRAVHDNAGLASERSKRGSTVATRRHRHRVLLTSTRHHSHTAARRTGVTGPACTSPAEITSLRSTMSNGVYGRRVRRSAVEQRRDRPSTARRSTVRQQRDRSLKHDGDPLPGSPSVIPQRTHGRVGRVLWEIGTADAETPQSSKSCDTRLAISVAILGGSPHPGGVAQLVRALPCHGRGRGFESRRSR